MKTALIIYFKDINLDIYQEVMNEKIKFFYTCVKQVMGPIGQGIIDEIRTLLKEINYHGYITIEQERDPRNSDTSLRDIKQSVDGIQEL